jgi:hypothetical protein
MLKPKARSPAQHMSNVLAQHKTAPIAQHAVHSANLNYFNISNALFVLQSLQSSIDET